MFISHRMSITLFHWAACVPESMLTGGRKETARLGFVGKRQRLRLCSPGAQRPHTDGELQETASEVLACTLPLLWAIAHVTGICDTRQTTTWRGVRVALACLVLFWSLDRRVAPGMVVFALACLVPAPAKHSEQVPHLYGVVRNLYQCRQYRNPEQHGSFGCPGLLVLKCVQGPGSNLPQCSWAAE